MKLLLCVITILLVQTVDLAQKASVKSEALFLKDLRPTVVKIPLPKHPADARGLGGESALLLLSTRTESASVPIRK